VDWHVGQKNSFLDVSSTHECIPSQIMQRHWTIRTVRSCNLEGLDGLDGLDESDDKSNANDIFDKVVLFLKVQW